MTLFVFLGQTFCDFLNQDYGDWTNAAIWTAATATILIISLIISVVGMSKQGAHVKTWHITGIIGFVIFIGAACTMAAPSVVHTFTVLSRKGDIADKSRDIRDNTDMMYQQYQTQCKARASALKSKIDSYKIDAPSTLASMYPNDQIGHQDFSETQSSAFLQSLMSVYDITWETDLRSKYESTLINNFRLLTGGASLKSLIAFHNGRYSEFTDHFAKIQNPFEKRDNFNTPEFKFTYVDYASEVSYLFRNKSAHAGGIILFIFTLLLGSIPFIFIKNNKVKSTRKAKEGEGIYNQGYPLK